MSRDSLDDVRTDRYANESTGSMQVVLGSVVAVVLYLALAWATISLPSVNETPLRFVVAVPLLLFLPGYSFLSTLFPGRPLRDSDTTSPLSRSARFGNVRSIEQRGITWGERAALSFGLSLVWLPILALLLAATPWSLTTEPMFAIVAVFVLSFTGVGAVRRARLPQNERFVLPYRRWFTDARIAFGRSPADTLLTAVLALSMLAAVTSIGYALAVPTDATTSTNVDIGTVNGSNQFVLDGYPTTFTADDPVTLTVLLENNEQRTVHYTVIGQFQRVSVTDNRVNVLDREETVRFRPTVSAGTNDTWRRTHEVTPPFSSDPDNVRLVYLVYTGPPPANPTIENADYYVDVWPGGDSTTNASA